MTEVIKQWIADQCDNAAPNTGSKVDFTRRSNYSAGLHKGIEIAEGFAEWVEDLYIQEEKGQWYDLGLLPQAPVHFFTTSQLLEKYIEQLGK